MTAIEAYEFPKFIPKTGGRPAGADPIAGVADPGAGVEDPRAGVADPCLGVGAGLGDGRAEPLRRTMTEREREQFKGGQTLQIKKFGGCGCVTAVWPYPWLQTSLENLPSLAAGASHGIFQSTFPFSLRACERQTGCISSTAYHASLRVALTSEIVLSCGTEIYNTSKS